MTTALPARINGNGSPAPTHWRGSVEGRPDVMPATSDIEQREEQRMEARLAAKAEDAGG
jgi:hypothetical protein